MVEWVDESLTEVVEGQCVYGLVREGRRPLTWTDAKRPRILRQRMSYLSSKQQAEVLCSISPTTTGPGTPQQHIQAEVIVLNVESSGNKTSKSS